MRITAITAAFLVCTLTLFASSSSAYADKTTKTKLIESSVITKPKTSSNEVQTITVSAGQSLTDIAATNNTTVERIFDANTAITNPDLIYPGEILVIPNTNQILAARPMPALAPASPATIVTASASPTAALTQPQQTSSGSNVWDEIAQCESGGNWSIDTGNGFYGGLQFSLSSWQAVGGVGYPNDATAAQQIAAAQQLESMQGWGAWPVCSSELGL